MWEFSICMWCPICVYTGWHFGEGSCCKKLLCCYDVAILVWEYSILQLLFAIIVLHLMYNILLKKMIWQVRDLQVKQLSLLEFAECCLQVKLAHALILGYFLPPKLSPSCETKNIWAWKFSSSQLINNKFWKWWFHVWHMLKSEWTQLIFLMTIFQTIHFEDGLIKIYIFLIASWKTCCPSNCLYFLTSNIWIENILLILHSDLSIILFYGFSWKVRLQREIKNFFSEYLFYQATPIGQW